ncbi:MAG: glycosyltransferase, partial [Kiritimatiellia bacterium]
MAKIRVLEMLEATTGGTRRHLNDLVANLNPELFQVSVLCSTRRDPAFIGDVERMRRSGIKVTVVPMVRAINPVWDVFCLATITTHLRKNRYDIVHTHSSKAGFLGRMAACLTHVPCVVHTPHVFPFQMQVGTPARILFHRLERFAARYTHAFICVCRAELLAAQSLNLSKDTAVFHVPNGLSDQAFLVETNEKVLSYRHSLGLEPDEIVIGHVGRFVSQKGHDILAKAMRAVVKKVPRTRLIMVGDGPHLRRIKRQIRTAALDSSCVIVPPHEDLRPYYAAFDILALPSRWEGMPYVLLEGMAAGKA